VVRARLRGDPTSDEAVGAALAVVAELAHLAGDILRARAQARLASRPPAVHMTALDGGTVVDGVGAARAIAGAVQALRDGVQDQLDVEGEEGADRQR
jgi:hypothetical protein